MFQTNTLRNKARHFIYTLLLLVSLTSTPTSHANADITSDPTTSVVEITVHTRQYDATSPWNTTWKSWIATGFIVDGNRILTTAQLVKNAVYISVRPIL